MNYLVFAFFFLASSFALGDFRSDTCERVDTQDVQVLYSQTVEYFFNNIASDRNNTVDATTLKIDKLGCLASSQNFIGLSYQLTWEQAPLDLNGAAQLCTYVVDSEANGIVVDDRTEPSCLNLDN